jgi:hypothetical protein
MPGQASLQYPVVNVPSIVYTTSSAQSSPENTSGVSLSSVHEWNKLVNNSASVADTASPINIPPIASGKVSMVPMTATEYFAVPYETATQNTVPMMGDVANASRFYVPPIEKHITKDHAENATPEKQCKQRTSHDYVFQFYTGSLTVVGLYILYRMIHKS